jgi:hypothetical protein
MAGFAKQSAAEKRGRSFMENAFFAWWNGWWAAAARHRDQSNIMTGKT